MRCLISVHDVMPETLPQLDFILERLLRKELLPATLLIVPGRNWTPQALDTVRQWQTVGFELAGHGWLHRAAEPRTIKHWLHARLFSADVAEHLALETDEIERLITACYAWFAENGLEQPELYVPPAWAMGPLPKDRLSSLPFAQYETLLGLFDKTTGRRQFLPLLGYEARTLVDKWTLKGWNALARRLLGRVPVRLAIHPNDYSHRLAADLDRLLALPLRAMSYKELTNAPNWCSRAL